MDLFSKRNAGSVASRKKISEIVGRQLVIIGNMHRGRGRPPRHVLGTQRLQLTLDVAHQVLTEVLRILGEHRVRIEAGSEDLLTRRGQRQFCSSLLSTMSRVKADATGADALDRLLLAAGPLLLVREERGQRVYITTDSATHFDVLVAASIEKARAERRKNASDSRVDILREGATALQNKTVKQARYDRSSDAIKRMDEARDATNGADFPDGEPTDIDALFSDFEG